MDSISQKVNKPTDQCTLQKRMAQSICDKALEDNLASNATESWLADIIRAKKGRTTCNNTGEVVRKCEEIKNRVLIVGDENLRSYYISKSNCQTSKEFFYNVSRIFIDMAAQSGYTYFGTCMHERYASMIFMKNGRKYLGKIVDNGKSITFTGKLHEEII